MAANNGLCVELGKATGMASAYFTNYAKTLNWVLFSELIDSHLQESEARYREPFRYARLPENLRNSVATLQAPNFENQSAEETA